MNVELPMILRMFILDWINTKYIKIDVCQWRILSINPSEGAMQFLEKNPDKIHWEMLSGNSSEGAIRLLERIQINRLVLVV